MFAVLNGLDVLIDVLSVLLMFLLVLVSLTGGINSKFGFFIMI